jgi:hypothetical protein
MRRSYIQLKVNGEYVMVPKEEAHLYTQDGPIGAAPYVIPDIQPYKSVITGEVIGSRSQHRSHLKQHGCIEVGNEKWPERKQVPMDSCVPELRQAVREFQRKRGR